MQLANRSSNLSTPFAYICDKLPDVFDNKFWIAPKLSV